MFASPFPEIGWEAGRVFQRVDVDVDVAFRMNMRMNLYAAPAALEFTAVPRGAEVTSGTRILKAIFPFKRTL